MTAATSRNSRRVGQSCEQITALAHFNSTTGSPILLSKSLAIFLLFRHDARMILRYPLTFHVLSCVLLLLSVTSRVSAQDAFDCRITLGDNNYDLTSLKGEHTVSQTRNTPPTQFRDSVTFNLCSDLQRKEDVSEKEQVGPPSSCVYIL